MFQFRFADPVYFLLVAPLVAAAWLAYRGRPGRSLVFSATARLPARRGTWRTRARIVCPGLYLLGAALSIIALARPQMHLSKTVSRTEGIAIEMVLDVSGSMAALDFSPKDRCVRRIDVVKETFGKFVKMRPNDLVGMVSFAGYAVTRAPLTIDHNALLHVLRGVEIPTQTYDKEGNILNQEELLTAIGDALATACERVRTADVKSKIAVLLSDGESNTGIIKPEDAMRAAAALGVKVYTIGIGSTGRAKFMGKDMFGRPAVGYAHVTLDEELLRRIADTTGGRYYNVRDPSALEKAMAEIDELEKTKIDKDVYNRYREFYPRFLVPAVFLVVIGAAINVSLVRKIV